MRKNRIDKLCETLRDKIVVTLRYILYAGVTTANKGFVKLGVLGWRKCWFCVCKPNLKFILLGKLSPTSQSPGTLYAIGSTKLDK